MFWLRNKIILNSVDTVADPDQTPHLAVSDLV